MKAKKPLRIKWHFSREPFSISACGRTNVSLISDKSWVKCRSCKRTTAFKRRK